MGNRFFKKFITNVRFIKTVSLINKDDKIKKVFLNLDMSTIAFGFIPSVLRKRYEIAIFILIAQLLNFFIIDFPFSILTNFIVTGIAAIITAKEYLNYLIDEEDFIPYSIWEDSNYKNEFIEKQLILSSKRSKNIVIISMIFIIITSMFSMTCYYKNSVRSTVITNSDEITINNFAIITIKEEKIESIIILNSNLNNDVEGIIYPGNLQIQLDNKVDELNKLIDINNREDLKKVFKNNFNIELQDFMMTTKVDNKDDINFYQDIFSSLLEVNENDIDDKIEYIEEKYSYLEALSARKFYDSFKDKNINISKLKYETVILGDIVDGKILETLDLLDKENYEFITVDKGILQNNELVRSINEKYDEYLQNQNEESNNATLNNVPVEEIITPPSNTGGSSQSTPPPSNTGGTGESTPPPSNNGGTGESTTPPSNNGETSESTTPPSNNGETSESTTPPSNNGGTGESTTPPSNNGETGESTPPPSNTGGSSQSTLPPSNNEQNSGSTSPINNGETSETKPSQSNNGGTEESMESLNNIEENKENI